MLEQREELIAEITLKTKYSLSYLENLSDKELRILHSRLCSESHV
ncbi:MULTISPECIES: hypothetical protein [unclassified Sporosarcina]|nr:MULTISPECIES: hypothetical protein [unclassified Sporosarcina]